MKLDSEESQRLKPSANAKPLPEHLKESDASLDITNRTDGVPEIGDPFHDPNSEQKWAEFNTAPDVTQKPARVDLSKENRLWYYLGKTSTEARPQYTENVAKKQHNPKSNFLDTVRPAAPVVAPFQHRSYPASYPIKPAPVSIPPRTPVQQQIKPYEYKPRESMMSTFRSPMYAPDTRKNPNSPVAHQPNVVYNHRGTPQYGHGQSAYQQTFHQHQQRPSQGYIPYVPPQSHSSNWKSQPTTSGPPQNGINQYAPPTPPTPYAPSGSPRELPPYPYQYSHGQGPMPRPAYNPSAPQPSASQPQPSSRSGAPISSLLSNPAGTSKPPMYATTYSSSIVPSAHSQSSQAEYLTYVTKYPYLKNAFLRRSKTYISPYSPDGGFTPEWMPEPASSAGGPPVVTAPRPPPSSQSAQSQGLGLNFAGGMPPNLPVPRPAPQFQSADAFRQDIAKAPHPPSGAHKWETMFKQLGTSTGVPPAPSTTASASPAQAAMATSQSPATRPPSAIEKAPKLAPAAVLTPTPAKSHTPPLPPPVEPQRPIPSPLSDIQKSPKRPEYSPISDDGKSTSAQPALLPPIHTGETWKYTQ